MPNMSTKTLSDSAQYIIGAIISVVMVTLYLVFSSTTVEETGEKNDAVPEQIQPSQTNQPIQPAVTEVTDEAT